MKRFLFVLGLLTLVFIKIADGQDTTKRVEKKPFREDTILSLIIKMIPDGWTITRDSNRMLIKRKDSIWVLKEQRQFADSETKDQLIKRVMEKGLKSTCYLLLTYEPKWSAGKIQDAKITNSVYYDKINKLMQKYNIARFEDKSESTRSNKVYKATNSNDQKILDAYNKEKDEIEKKIIRLPDYHSST